MDPKDVRISPLLTQTSLGWKQDGYIAEELFPVIPVQKDSAKILIYGMDSLRIEQSLRAPGAPAAEVSHAVSIGDHYNLEEHAFKEDVPDELRDNAEAPINVDVDTTENLTEKLTVTKEKAVADVVTNTGIITQNATPGSLWSDFVNSDPFADIKLAKATVFDATGKDPNTFMLAKNLLETLLIHPLVIQRFPGTAAVTQAQVLQYIALLFGFDKMLVGKAKYNSAKEGKTGVLANIWSADALVAYIEPKPGLKSRSLGFTYQKADQHRAVQKWRDPDLSAKKDWISVSDKYDQKLVDADCAYLINNAI